jgi:hypothetical protein
VCTRACRWVPNVSCWWHKLQFHRHELSLLRTGDVDEPRRQAPILLLCIQLQVHPPACAISAVSWSKGYVLWDATTPVCPKQFRILLCTLHHITQKIHLRTPPNGSSWIQHKYRHRGPVGMFLYTMLGTKIAHQDLRWRHAVCSWILGHRCTLTGQHTLYVASRAMSSAITSHQQNIVGLYWQPKLIHQ